MANQYDKLFGKSAGVEAPAGVSIDGAFACQHCGEIVDEATWYMSADLLVWKCEENHVSKIEEFTL